MSLPQYIGYIVGGTVFCDVGYLPKNAQLRIYSGDGTEILGDTNATISTINTVLNAAVSKGALSLTVNLNTGITAGAKFYLSDDKEEVLARKVAGTTISLRRPVIYDHVSGATVEGGRITYDVNSTTSNVLFWDGYIFWNIGKTDGNVSHQYTSCVCTKYPLRRTASSLSMSDIEPKLYYLIDTESDIERLLDLGHEEVLKRVGQKAPDQRVRVMPSSVEWEHATGLAAWMYFYMGRPGPDAKDLTERYEARLCAEIDRIIPLIPRDANQDGVIKDDEKISVNSRRIRRA